jgi:hypothetical protein
MGCLPHRRSAARGVEIPRLREAQTENDNEHESTKKGKQTLKTTYLPTVARNGPRRVHIGLVVAAAVFLHRDATAIQFKVDSDLASSLAVPVGYGISLADAVDWTTITVERATIPSTSITGRGGVVMITEQFAQRMQSTWTTLPLANPLANPGRDFGRRALTDWSRNSGRTGGIVNAGATSVPDGGSTLLLLGSVLLFGSGLATWLGFRRRFLPAVQQLV